MSSVLAEELLVQPTDPRLLPVAEKVLAGERLSEADGLALFETHDLLADRKSVV